MTYRLILRAPFGVVLVHRSSYERQEDAQDRAEALPKGFEVVSEEQVPADAVPVPIRYAKDTLMKTEDIRRYEAARLNPFLVGDHVYIPAKHQMGTIVAAEGLSVTVELEGMPSLSEVLSVSEVLHVKKP